MPYFLPSRGIEERAIMLSKPKELGHTLRDRMQFRLLLPIGLDVPPAHGRRSGNWKPIGTTLENLEAAIAGETLEFTSQYPAMAATAREEGFPEIADWFERLARAEHNHADRFRRGLDSTL